MNAPIPMTLAHLLIIWTLLAFLLTWIILFTFLALRPDSTKKTEVSELALPTETLPSASPMMPATVTQSELSPAPGYDASSKVKAVPVA